MAEAEQIASARRLATLAAPGNQAEDDEPALAVAIAGFASHVFAETLARATAEGRAKARSCASACFPQAVADALEACGHSEEGLLEDPALLCSPACEQVVAAAEEVCAQELTHMQRLFEGFAMTRRLLHARHCTETESWSGWTDTSPLTAFVNATRPMGLGFTMRPLLELSVLNPEQLRLVTSEFVSIAIGAARLAELRTADVAGDAFEGDEYVGLSIVGNVGTGSSVLRVLGVQIL